MPGSSAVKLRPVVHRWGRWKGELTSERDRPNPVQDVEVSVELTAPSGARHRAVAFWDGGRVWRVRFCPDEVGKWRYGSVCSDATDPGLHGRSGTFTCRPYEGDNPLYWHGQIRVASSGRHLEHADGVPFFFLADTCWNGPHLAERAEWDDYLADRAARRFGAVIFTAPHFRALAANADGRTAFSGRERIAIDPLFFQRLDRSIDAMNDRGLLAVPLLLHAGKDTDRNSGHYLPEDQAVLLARYLISRYDAHHVLWDLVAEGEFHGGGAHYWKRIARAVFADGRRHPVTLHPYGMDWALYDFVDEPWMDVVGYQSAHGDNEAYLRWIPEGPPSTSWKLKPARPFINLEPPYEGHLAYHSGQPFDAAIVRRHTYWSLLVSPVAGVAYGGHGVWGWDDGTGAPFAHEQTGPAPHWREALGLPGATAMQHLAELMASLPWWTFSPSPELLAEQPGRDDARLTVVAARGDGGQVGIVYVPRGSRLRLNPALVSTVTRGVWVDPRTGTRSVAPLPSDGAVSTPDGEDWVLLLEGLSMEPA
ncbi:MAG: DUF4038 domain-containing protein [Thermomicrobiales bacterium]